MFDYLSVDSPARLSTHDGYTVGVLRTASDYYRDHDVIKELRVVAKHASTQEAFHYRQHVVGMTSTVSRVLNEYIEGSLALSEPVVMSLLELSARLRFTPEWGMIDGLIMAETIGALLDNAAGSIYLAILGLTSANRKVYATYWRCIEQMSQPSTGPSITPLNSVRT